MKYLVSSEKKYCPFCGSENSIENRFCSNCGAQLPAQEGATIKESSPTTDSIPSFTPTAVTPQPYQQPGVSVQQPYQQPITHYPQTVVVQTIPQKKQITAGAIIGFIINMVTFLFLSWYSWWVPIWWVIIFLIITIVGIVLSAKAMRSSPGLSITGMVLGILGSLPQLVALIILVIAISLYL